MTGRRGFRRALVTVLLLGCSASPDEMGPVEDTQGDDWVFGSVLRFAGSDLADHERFAVVGQAGGCLAAFRMTDASGSPQAWVVPPEEFDLPGLRVTADSVYGPGTAMSEEWARGQGWRSVTPDEARQAFTGCLP